MVVVAWTPPILCGGSNDPALGVVYRATLGPCYTHSPQHHLLAAVVNYCFPNLVEDLATVSRFVVS